MERIQVKAPNMSNQTLSKQEKDTAIDSQNDLPLNVVDRSASVGEVWDGGRKVGKIRKLLRLVVFAVDFIAVGGLLGLYFQPPGLQKAMATLGLNPGGGTSNPIAVPVEQKVETPVPVSQPSPGILLTLPGGAETVIGLGRLEPKGELTTIATPSGAGDSRLSRILVEEGERVEAGQLLAVLDNEERLKASLEASRSLVKLREADLANRRITVASNAAEARASLESARASALNAEQDLDRFEKLFARQIVSRSAVDPKRSAAEQARRAVEQAEAKLARYTGPLEEQGEVVVAKATLNAAKADLRTVEQNLAQSRIVSPINGTVLSVNNRAGERPSTEGIMTVGNIDQMIAKVEIYQSQIGFVKLGNQASLVADALNGKLAGRVSRIGMEVKRQTLIGSDPAANTDAKVVKITIVLDETSSKVASRFTNLQVVATVSTGIKE